MSKKNETAATPVAKVKRKYTKKPRWTVKIGDNVVETSGLIEALNLTNEKLRDNVCDEVTITRIKRDA